jgi:hypothetical protein
MFVFRNVMCNCISHYVICFTYVSILYALNDWGPGLRQLHVDYACTMSLMSSILNTLNWIEKWLHFVSRAYFNLQSSLQFPGPLEHCFNFWKSNLPGKQLRVGCTQLFVDESWILQPWMSWYQVVLMWLWTIWQYKSCCAFRVIRQITGADPETLETGNNKKNSMTHDTTVYVNVNLVRTHSNCILYFIFVTV